jgi:hypothetical protein
LCQLRSNEPVEYALTASRRRSSAKRSHDATVPQVARAMHILGHNSRSEASFRVRPEKPARSQGPVSDEAGWGGARADGVARLQNQCVAIDASLACSMVR